MDATCGCCGGEFSRKAKGFQRTSINAKTKEGIRYGNWFDKKKIFNENFQHYVKA